jgi:predicted ester cyclase
MAITTQNNVTLIRSLLDLYNSHQTNPAWLDKSLAFFAEDCEIVDVPSGTTSHGPEGYKQLILFFAEGFPGSTVKITNLFATEDQVTVEFTGQGINTGPLYLPTGELPPTGRRAELRFCDVYQIKRGKIVSYHIYYDALGLMQQLGLIPS